MGCAIMIGVRYIDEKRRPRSIEIDAVIYSVLFLSLSSCASANRESISHFALASSLRRPRVHLQGLNDFQTRSVSGSLDERSLPELGFFRC